MAECSITIKITNLCIGQCFSNRSVINVQTSSLSLVSPQSRLEECNEQLELRHRQIVEFHEREKVLGASFQASLGKNNKFEDFLTKVFKKKVKRVKKAAQEVNEGGENRCSVSMRLCDALCSNLSFTVFTEEVNSEEDSNEDDDWDEEDDDDYDSGTEEAHVPLNDNICPPGQ